MDIVILLISLFLILGVSIIVWKQGKEVSIIDLNSIKKGDKVVTVGGLYGVVDEVNGRTITIDCDGVYLDFEIEAIKRKVFNYAD